MNFGFFHINFFRICYLLLIFVFLVDLIRKNEVRRNLKQNIRQNFPLLFMIIWLLYAIISGFWVVSRGAWLSALYFVGLGTFSTVIFSQYLRKTEDFCEILSLLTPVFIVHQLIGWNEVVNQTYYFLKESRLERHLRYRYPISSFANTNDFAFFLMFAIFISLINFLRAEKWPLKILNLIIMASSMSLLYFSGARAIIIGIVMAMFGLLWVLERPLAIKLTKLIGVGLIAIVFVNIFFNPFLFNRIKNYLEYTFSFVNSITIRVNLIRNGLFFLIQTYGMGVGAGNIEIWLELFRIFDISRIRKIHNWWLEILVAYGVGIFIAYLISYYQLVRTMVQGVLHVKNKKIKIIALGFFCILISFIIGSLSPSSLVNLEWFWLFWGIMISFHILVKGEIDQDSTSKEQISNNKTPINKVSIN